MFDNLEDFIGQSLDLHYRMLPILRGLSAALKENQTEESDKIKKVVDETILELETFLATFEKSLVYTDGEFDTDETTFH